MGKRGPAPQPTALKLLAGVKPSRVNSGEPLPASGDVEPPSWLPSDALAVWRRLAPDLTRQGVLTPWDCDLFADYCCMVEINRAALEDLAVNGASVMALDRVLADGTVSYRLTRNPQWQVARESASLLVTLAGRFGLSPSDRAQLHVNAPNPSGLGPERLLS